MGLIYHRPSGENFSFDQCQYPSKFDVTRPSDFHRVLKTSVLINTKENKEMATFWAQIRVQ